MKKATCSVTFIMAPRAGVEPTTLSLTATCSAIELPRKKNLLIFKGIYFVSTNPALKILLKLARSHPIRCKLGVEQFEWSVVFC